MMNLSRVSRSPTQYTEGSVASTEVITNRSTPATTRQQMTRNDFNDDENDSTENDVVLISQHELATKNPIAMENKLTRKWPPVQTTTKHKFPRRNSGSRSLPIVVQQRVEINSIMSFSSTEASSVLGRAPSTGSGLSVGKLSRHVGNDLIKKSTASSKVSHGSSLQSKSISSSVGVEIGGQSIQRGVPGLKKLLTAPTRAPNIPLATSAWDHTVKKDPIGKSLLGPRKEDLDELEPERIVFDNPTGLFYRPEERKSVLSMVSSNQAHHIPQQGESMVLPSLKNPALSKLLLANLSPERASTTSNNPFVVCYSAQDQGENSVDTIPRYDNPHSPASSGWTPVALSSSGLEAEDFAQHTSQDKPNITVEKSVPVPLFSRDRLDLGHSPSKKWSAEDAAKLVPKIEPPLIRRVTKRMTNVPLSEGIHSGRNQDTRITTGNQETTTSDEKWHQLSTPTPHQSLNSVLTHCRARDLINRRRDGRRRDATVEKDWKVFDPSHSEGMKTKDDKILRSSMEISESRHNLESREVLKDSCKPTLSMSTQEHTLSWSSPTLVQERIKALTEGQKARSGHSNSIQPKTSSVSLKCNPFLFEVDSTNDVRNKPQKTEPQVYPSDLKKLSNSRDDNARASGTKLIFQTGSGGDSVTSLAFPISDEVTTVESKVSPVLRSNRFLSAIVAKNMRNCEGKPDLSQQTDSCKTGHRFIELEVDTKVQSQAVEARAVIRDTSPFRGDETPNKLILMGAHLASRTYAISSLPKVDQWQDEECVASVDVPSIRSIFEGSVASKVDIDNEDDDETIDSMDVKSLRSFFESGGEEKAIPDAMDDKSAVKKMLAKFESPKPLSTSMKSFLGNNSMKEARAKFELPKTKLAKTKKSVQHQSHVPVTTSSDLNTAPENENHSASLFANAGCKWQVPSPEGHISRGLSSHLPTPTLPSIPRERRKWELTVPGSESDTHQNASNNIVSSLAGTKGCSAITRDVNPVKCDVDNSRPDQFLGPLQVSIARGKRQSLATFPGGTKAELKPLSKNTRDLQPPIENVERRLMSVDNPEIDKVTPQGNVSAFRAKIVLKSDLRDDIPETKHHTDGVAGNNEKGATLPDKNLGSPRRMTVADRIRALKARQNSSQSSATNSRKKSSLDSQVKVIKKAPQYEPTLKHIATCVTPSNSPQVTEPITSSLWPRSVIPVAPGKSPSSNPALSNSWPRSKQILQSPQVRDAESRSIDLDLTDTRLSTRHSISIPNVTQLSIPDVPEKASFPRTQDHSSVRDRIRSYSLTQSPSPPKVTLYETPHSTTTQNSTAKYCSTSIDVQSELVSSPKQLPKSERENAASNKNNRNHFKPIHSQLQKPTDSLRSNGFIITKKALKVEATAFPPDSTSRGESECFDDGVTLDLSIADVSQLTNPTCLQSKEDPTDYSINDDDDSSDQASPGRKAKHVETEGRGPSEASSSQTSEAAVPLIARTMKRFAHSDDGSASIDRTNKWEPITPVIDEGRDTTWQESSSKQENKIKSRAPSEKQTEISTIHANDKPMDEAAWDLGNVISNFPPSSPIISSGFEVDPFEVTPQPARNRESKRISADNNLGWKPFLLDTFSLDSHPCRLTRPRSQHPERLVISTSTELAAVSTPSHSQRRLQSPSAPTSKSYRNSPTSTYACLERNSTPSPRTDPVGSVKASSQENSRNVSPGLTTLIPEPEPTGVSSLIFGRTRPMKYEPNRMMHSVAVASPSNVAGRITSPTSSGVLRSSPTNTMEDSKSPRKNFLFSPDQNSVRKSPTPQISSSYGHDSSQHSDVQKQSAEYSMANESSTGSKHAALLLRLRSLKEGRMRRGSFAQPISQNPSTRLTSDTHHSMHSVVVDRLVRRPNFVAPTRAQSISSSRPGAYSSQYIANRCGQPFGKVNGYEDEQSQSTMGSSTRFGGNAFSDCLDLD